MRSNSFLSFNSKQLSHKKPDTNHLQQSVHPKNGVPEFFADVFILPTKSAKSL